MKQIIPPHLHGIFDMFVDDLMGFGHHSIAAADQQTAQAILRQFFGPDAVDAKSIPPCTQAELLGWAIDLNTQTVEHVATQPRCAERVCSCNR